MKYFTENYIAFFNELKENNNKAWFDENRKKYGNHVKNPFKEFVGAFINEVEKSGTPLLLQPSDCIFRINRDIRFSKDKTPYKTNCSAVIVEGGKKEKEIPGLYFEIGYKTLNIYGGVYMASTPQVKAVRDEIAYNLKEFQALVNEKNFKKLFGEILGEKVSRTPKGYEDVATQEPLIFNKSWYFMAQLPIETICQENLLEVMMTYYNAMQPLCNFLKVPMLEGR
jgi:uncharacterized protein (TIGR02453 family)